MPQVLPYAPAANLLIYRGGEVHDITAADVREVHFQKKLGEPAGNWSCLLVMRRHPDGLTWADKITPNDYAVLRLGYKPLRTSEGLPVIMRGFVDTVSITESMEGGKPQRRIVINGRDYGKLLMQTKLYFLPELDAGLAAEWLTKPALTLERYFGIDVGDLRINRLVPALVEKVINLQMERFMTWAGGVVPQMKVKAAMPDRFKVSTLITLPGQIAAWQLLEEFHAPPWTEMFVDSRDATLISRLAPLKTKEGALGWEDAVDPGKLEVSAQDISERQLGRGDAQAFSYFFVVPQQPFLSTLAYKASFAQVANKEGFAEVPAAAINPILLSKNLARFGFRPLELRSNLIDLKPGLAQGEVDEAEALAKNFMAPEQCLWLAKVYGHNHELWGGSLVMRGRPDMQIGQYLLCKEYGQEFYIEAVEHEFVMFERFVTRLGVTRGRQV